MLVGSVGIEPTQPEVMDLQSTATLLLCRLPVIGGVERTRTAVLDADLTLHLVETLATPILYVCMHL